MNYNHSIIVLFTLCIVIAAAAIIKHYQKKRFWTYHMTSCKYVRMDLETWEFEEVTEEQYMKNHKNNQKVRSDFNLLKKEE